MQPLDKAIILNGLTGSGKHALSVKLADKHKLTYISVGNKVDDIRELIEQCIALANPTLFFIDDADNLTMQAQNALLKIFEEPPANCYIMLGVASMSNILDTIKSRAKTRQMPTFNYQQLNEHYKKSNLSVHYKDAFLKCAKTPGRMMLLAPIFDDVYEYAEKVLSNILIVSTGNSYKICNEIAFKDTDKGVNLQLFWECFLHLSIRENEYEFVPITTKAINSIQNKSFNKRLIFDIWVLDIRRLR